MIAAKIVTPSQPRFLNAARPTITIGSAFFFARGSRAKPRFDVSRHSSGDYEFNRRGLGLGLSMVKLFVEMHGGQVEAKSESGKGTTFTITLPADAPGP